MKKLIKPKRKNTNTSNTENSLKTKDSKSAPAWVTYVTLAIALIGVIPIGIAIVDYLNRGPKFKIVLEESLIGLTELSNKSDKMETYTSVFCSVSIYNNGDKSLFPHHFDLQIECDGQKINTTRRRIEKDMYFTTSDNRPIDIEELLNRDLSKKSRRIEPGNTDYGYLLFVTKTSRDVILNAKIRILHFACTDSDGKHYFSDEPLDTIDSTGSMAPRSGFEIK